MVELTTGFATLSLFLLWRLHVVGSRLRMTIMLLRGVVEGDVVITKTDNGIELEVKSNG